MNDLLLPVNATDHILGNPNAAVTLVEYGDYECPHCGRAHGIVARIMKEAGGELRFVFRNFPLSRIHPHAFQAALAAEAAGLQDKFWEMHDTLMTHQDALEPEDLLNYASGLKLDVEQFASDMSSQKVEVKVLQDIDSGFRSGVYGTPTFFINGHRHDDSYAYEVLAPAVLGAVKV